MRAVIPLLVLLFSMHGGQTKSTHTEVQRESRSTGAATFEVNAEIKELRDMVYDLATRVVELRTTLTFTQNELQNTKSLLYRVNAENEAQNQELTAQHTALAALTDRLVASDTKVEDLERVNAAQEVELTAVKMELTAVKTRLAASETEVMNLKTVTASQTERLAVTETDMENMKNDTAAQHTDLTTVKAEVINLIRDSAAQETRLSASETKVKNLKVETAAQSTEMTTVKTRLAATENTVNSKVAFSASLGITGDLVTFTDINLTFGTIISNVGDAYNSANGFFTAPFKGVYYFGLTAADLNFVRAVRVKLVKNGTSFMHFVASNTVGQHVHLSGGVTLQLEVGDEINVLLPAGSIVEDFIGENYTTFTGFLLFPL